MEHSVGSVPPMVQSKTEQSGLEVNPAGHGHAHVFGSITRLHAHVIGAQGFCVTAIVFETDGGPVMVAKGGAVLVTGFGGMVD